MVEPVGNNYWQNSYYPSLYGVLSNSNPLIDYRSIDYMPLKKGGTLTTFKASPDSVEISAKNKLKTENKKHGISTGAKIALGLIGSAVAAGVLINMLG